MPLFPHEWGSTPQKGRRVKRRPTLVLWVRRLLWPSLVLAATALFLPWNQIGVRLHNAPDAHVHPALVDVSAADGLQYHWKIAGPRPINILQGIGNGCAFLDFNNDGNLDILLIGPQVALYRGDGHGHFTDVTHQTGLDALHADFHGCAVGDYDNDGWEDVYLSGYHTGVLLHNENGHFRDVTAEAGLKPQDWGSSCAWADVNGDGKLDLYVGNYVRFGPKSKQLCDYHGIMAACGPRAYPAEHGRLYLNDGHGKFRDATQSWGVLNTAGNTLGVAVADYDRSGHPSIALANDEVPGALLHNIGSRFTDTAHRAGVAFDPTGNPQGGMGIDWGDYDNDGWLDLFVGTFQAEVKDVYHNNGDGTFTQQAGAVGLFSPTLNVTFGAKWFDLDNDGWLDLILANGHIEDNAAQVEAGRTFRQPLQLFHSIHEDQQLHLKEIPAGLIGPAQRPLVGRGLAIGDFDNDGRIDVLVADSEGVPVLLHNETKNSGHWLMVTLEGTQSNRDGLGALLTLQAGGRTLLRQCQTGGSYLSASDRRVHFGLATARQAEALTIQWPSGHSDVIPNLPADQCVHIREGGTMIP